MTWFRLLLGENITEIALKWNILSYAIQHQNLFDEQSRNALHFLTTCISRLRLKDDCYFIFINVVSIIDNQAAGTMKNTDAIRSPTSAVSKISHLLFVKED